MKRQKGATLIIVMILLIIITGIGTLAIRESLTSLNIATNSQATQLMLQNSDSVLFQIEKIAEEGIDVQMMKNGMFGYIDGDSNKGNELVFCYKGNESTFFNLDRASISKLDALGNFNNTSLGTEGYCKVDKANNFFTSGRRAVMTQISIVYPDSGSVIAFADYPRGSDFETFGGKKPELVVVNAISIMPALTTASDNNINNCFSNFLSNSKYSNVSSCLAELNVPYRNFVTEYALGSAFI
nr:pilus assembly protein PilX [Acinetobacter sp. Marseille-Q1620]